MLADFLVIALGVVVICATDGNLKRALSCLTNLDFFSFLFSREAETTDLANSLGSAEMLDGLFFNFYPVSVPGAFPPGIAVNGKFFALALIVEYET